MNLVQALFEPIVLLFVKIILITLAIFALIFIFLFGSGIMNIIKGNKKTGLWLIASLLFSIIVWKFTNSYGLLVVVLLFDILFLFLKLVWSLLKRLRKRQGF